MKKHALRTFLGLTSISLMIGFQQNADAAIYKCVSAKGETYYNDKACPKNNEETQLNNIKDPVGGYIPPAFKKDEEDQLSKGVAVGGNSVTKNDIKLEKEMSDSENINQSSANDLSNADDSNPDTANENIIESSYANTENRTRPKTAAKKPLATKPLKREVVTKEPRSIIN